MRKEGSSPESNYQDGQWNLVHLKFLTDFMEETGLTTASVAELLGISRQAVYYWFKKDDVKISVIYKLFEVYGYKIEFDLIKERTSEGEPAKVEMQVQRKQKTGKRLEFLASALKRYNIYREDISPKMGIVNTTIYYWLSHDDVFISYIYKLAELAGLKVTIRITPNND
jgi:transcriptional regulator with XRE-family HTH domain